MTSFVRGQYLQLMPLENPVKPLSRRAFQLQLALAAFIGHLPKRNRRDIDHFALLYHLISSDARQVTKRNRHCRARSEHRCPEEWTSCILPVRRLVFKEIPLHFAVKIRVWLCCAVDVYRRYAGNRNAVTANRHNALSARHKVQHTRQGCFRIVVFHHFGHTVRSFIAFAEQTAGALHKSS